MSRVAFAVRRKAWAEALALIAAELRRPDVELQARALEAEHLAAGGLTLDISLRRRALARELLEVGLAELPPQAQEVLLGVLDLGLLGGADRFGH